MRITLVALLTLTACGTPQALPDPVRIIDDGIFNGLNEFGDPTYVSLNPVWAVASVTASGGTN